MFLQLCHKPVNMRGAKMKKALLIFMFLFISMPVFAGQPQGFQDIPFGTPYDKVLASLQKKKVKKEIPTYLQFGDSLAIENFHLGDLRTTVVLGFDAQKKFYKFIFTTKEVSWNELETTALRQMDFISKTFKKKYGPAEECFEPLALGLKKTEATPGCIWEHNKLYISTGIIDLNSGYAAVGMVSSRELTDALVVHEKKAAEKRAADGAQKF